MKTLYQLRNENAIPAGALVQIPDGWQSAGVARHETNRFEWQPCYKKDGVTMTEAEMLKAGIAHYYIELGQFKRRVFTLAA